MYIIHEPQIDTGRKRSSLEAWGWDSFFEGFARTSGTRGEPARVIEARRGSFLVTGEAEGDDAPGAEAVEAVLSGRFAFEAREVADFPAAGDWVLVERSGSGPATIHAVLPRRTKLSRKSPGETAHDRLSEQVMAANVDTVFVVSQAGPEFSDRRLERYAATVRESGARLVVVLTKADLCPDTRVYEERARRVCPYAHVVALSSVTGAGLDALDAFLEPGRTVVFLGSSGVGKSTLLNALAGRRLEDTGPTKAFDGKGRHTTTSRTLYRLGSGALVIDTPGMRELQLWADDNSVTGSFPEIEKLAAACRFSDCAHGREPGCAVREALEDGELEEDRWKGWLSLRAEVRFLETRIDPRAAREMKTALKRRAKACRDLGRR